MGLTPKDGDALVPERLGKLDPVSFAAAQAVASAVRELSEHEAAYSRDDILRTALQRHGPFSVAEVEARIDLLRGHGLLIGGEELLTRQQTIDLEQRVIGVAREGIGATTPIMEGRLLAAKVQAKATDLGLRRLNPGQLGAAVGILSSANRVELVQGGAGGSPDQHVDVETRHKLDRLPLSAPHDGHRPVGQFAASIHRIDKFGEQLAVDLVGVGVGPIVGQEGNDLLRRDILPEPALPALSGAAALANGVVLAFT